MLSSARRLALCLCVLGCGRPAPVSRPPMLAPAPLPPAAPAVTAQAPPVAPPCDRDPVKRQDQRPADLRDGARRCLDLGRHLRAEAYYQLAVKQSEEGAVDRDELLASLSALAGLHEEDLDWPRAEAPLRRILQIQEERFGADSPPVADALTSLGRCLHLQGDHARAVPLLERALNLREGPLEFRPRQTMETLIVLGAVHGAAGALDRAERSLRRAEAIAATPNVTLVPIWAYLQIELTRLALRRHDLPRAEAITRRLVEETAGARWSLREQVHALELLGLLQVGKGHTSDALSTYSRVTLLAAQHWGPIHPRLAHFLLQRAWLYRTHLHDMAQAGPLYLQALTIAEQSVGKSRPLVADVALGLAQVRIDEGDDEAAEPLLHRALKIRERTFGQDHPLVAEVLEALGEAYQSRSDQRSVEQAEQMLQRALAIRVASAGARSLEAARTLSLLGRLRVYRGAYARAEPLLAQALTILRRAPLADQWMLAATMSAMAELQHARGALPRAIAQLLEALAIYDRLPGEQQRASVTLLQLGQLHETLGQNTQALGHYQRALMLREQRQGAGPLEPLTRLARLHITMGASDRAEPLLRRAMALGEVTLGSSHPDLYDATHLLFTLLMGRLDRERRLGSAVADQGEGKAPAALLRQALGLVEHGASGRYLTFLEHQGQLSYDHDMLDLQRQVYTRLLREPGDRSLQRLAAVVAVVRKGQIVDQQADLSQSLYQRLTADDRERFLRLRELRAELAQRSLAGRGVLTTERYEEQQADLSRRIYRLEQALADRAHSLAMPLSQPQPSSPAIQRQARPRGDELLDQVVAALPPESVLVDFVDVPVGGQRRYVALVLRPSGDIAAVDLASVDELDKSVELLLAGLRSPAGVYAPAAEQLFQRLMAPLLPRLLGARTLILCPDGALHLIPFAVLLRDRGPRVDAYQLRYLTSARDLLQAKRTQQSGAAVLLGDPAFDAAPRRAAGPDRSPGQRESRGLTWRRLPNARREIEELRLLLPDATTLLDEAATKEALLAVERPRILHIATHGLFLSDRGASPRASRGLVESGGPAGRELAVPRSPLLRALLVLAGAARNPTPRDRPADTGLATALEVSGMNLWGTQLVVLSACDTGRGVTAPGEGVYGMRRALAIAGAETVVTSLWEVNDATTHDLMLRFYRGLLDGKGRAEALDAAMEQVRQAHPHPYYWAPFLAIGAAGPLRSVSPPKPPQDE